MTSSADVLVKVDGVSKKFCRSFKRSLWYGVQDVAAELNPFARSRNEKESSEELREGEFWAVNDVSFELRRGECLGLIGRNGAGKTTLLKMLNGLIKPDRGHIEMRGRVGALIALGAGFNPILTGRENIYVNASILGLAKGEINEKIDDIIDFAEIRDARVALESMAARRAAENWKPADTAFIERNIDAQSKASTLAELSGAICLTSSARCRQHLRRLPETGRSMAVPLSPESITWRQIAKWKASTDIGYWFGRKPGW